MTKVIEVLYVPSYGRDLFRPLNDDAVRWADAFRTKSFTKDALRLLELQGYEIKILRKEIKL